MGRPLSGMLGGLHWILRNARRGAGRLERQGEEGAMKRLILLCGVMVMAGGCVTKKTMLQAVDEAEMRCQFTIRGIQAELDAKTDRLRRFNQVNPDGSLR
jgi:hypothetical protein